MIPRLAAVLLLAALASCPRLAAPVRDAVAPDLETAAILRGLVRDPADTDVVGLYARDTDRLCIVRGDGALRVGAFTDYGDGIACRGAGAARRSGGRLTMTLGEDCEIDARYDGDRIVFPSTVPAGCARLCGRRATFAALDVSRLSASPSEAAAMRDPAGTTPCAS